MLNYDGMVDISTRVSSSASHLVPSGGHRSWREQSCEQRTPDENVAILQVVVMYFASTVFDAPAFEVVEGIATSSGWGHHGVTRYI